LSGPAGCGKTALAVALLIEEGGVPGWITATDYVDRVRSQSMTPESLHNQADPLVLDDLGAEYATYFSNQSLDSLVALYYEKRSRLIITTNLTEDKIPEFYSERMLDRLLEGSSWVDMVNPSFRRLPHATSRS
jgi:DNA replication protein DnaC